MNKEEIKVYLKYPWGFPDSAYYKYLVDFPPEEVKFENIPKKSFKLISSKKRVFLNHLKKSIHVARRIIPVPNLVSVKKTNADLIHCAHCLNLTKKPWVVDVEDFWSLGGDASHTKIGKSIITKMLNKKECKKILPWTKFSENNIKKNYKSKNINEKMELVYPAVPVKKIKLKSKKDNPGLIFVSRYFWLKGGLLALEVFKRIKEKYDINTTFISEVPTEFKKKYKTIKINSIVPQKELMKDYFPKSDIFFYPSMVDTFGFSILEAMSFKMPTIALETNRTGSINEIIENNKAGFVIDAKKFKSCEVRKIGKNEEGLIKELTKKASFLIENSSARKKMGDYARNLVENGKFSIGERNKKLRRIYEEAIK